MTNVLSIVSYSFLPAKMGGHKGIALFYQYFGQKVDLTCVSTRQNEEKFTLNYRLIKLFGKSGLRYINPFYFFPLRRIIKEKKIEWILLEHPYYGWLAFLLKYLCGVKLLAKSHNIESIRFKSIGKWWWGIMWQYEKFVFKMADKAFFITEEDRAFAIKNYQINASKCHVITYGTERAAIPSPVEKKAAKEALKKMYGLGNEYIYLFNGTLDYKPNSDGLKAIIGPINDYLLANNPLPYKIIICGKNLPAALNNLADYAGKHIIYAGFVNDIDIYFKGADCFLNPVIEGGGIKTKVVEALGLDLDVITTKSGAIGIPAAVAGNKMKIVEDSDWRGFAKEALQILPGQHTGALFFDHFYWETIGEKAADILI
ncbi:MAG: glycosyltransferase [Ferruginibacter sp.]